MAHPAQLIQNGHSAFIAASAAAKVLGCSLNSVYRLLERGDLRGIRFGERGWWKVERESVAKLLLGSRPPKAS